MTNEEYPFPDQLSAVTSCTRRETCADAPPSPSAEELDLSDLQRLLEGVVHGPVEPMDGAAVALVRKAGKARHKLSVLLALRSMRLDKKLREAQRRVIELQWELAQIRRCIAPAPVAAGELED